GRRNQHNNILSCGREIWPEKGGARPDDPWFEPRGRSEAGTCRLLQREGVPSDSGVALSYA
ncbi:MAG: hypothetical protein Q6K35_11855, partial [Thermostichus sp. DG02_4_bins_136]